MKLCLQLSDVTSNVISKNFVMLPVRYRECAKCFLVCMASFLLIYEYFKLSNFCMLNGCTFVVHLEEILFRPTRRPSNGNLGLILI